LKNLSPKIQIFLLCYNRPDSALVAAQSIFDQLDENSRLIISNNSTDPYVGIELARKFPTIEIRHRGGLKSKEHFQLCMHEASEDYFCLFHDDDVMLPGFIDEIKSAIFKFPDAQAIATNAILHETGKGDIGKSFKHLFNYRKISSKKELIDQYFGKGNCGIAPFPSYVYRRKSFATPYFQKIKDIDLGKYEDVLLVLSQLEAGFIVWINKPLIEYNLHEFNDGRSESIKDRLKLLSELKDIFKLDSSIVLSYRLFLFDKVRHIKQSNRYNLIADQLRKNRRKKVFKYLYSQLPCVLKSWI